MKHTAQATYARNRVPGENTACLKHKRTVTPQLGKVASFLLRGVINSGNNNSNAVSWSRTKHRGKQPISLIEPQKLVPFSST